MSFYRRRRLYFTIATSSHCDSDGIFPSFYTKHSLAEHDRYEVAIACLLLAAKTEESPKKLAVVITECWRLKNRGLQQQQQKQSGDSSAIKPISLSIDTKSNEYTELRERILLLERVILHTIAFELSIDHPYKFLVETSRKLTQNRSLEYIDSNKPIGGMTNELLQNAMSFAQDSLHTTLCLQFPAKTIALGCVYLSAKHCAARPTAFTKSWLDVLGIDYESLTSICIQIIEQLADRRKGNPAIFQSIQNELFKLKEEQRQTTKLKHNSHYSSSQTKKSRNN